VLKEITVHEYRIGMIPASGREAIHHGYLVTAKTGADSVIITVLVLCTAALTIPANAAVSEDYTHGNHQRAEQAEQRVFSGQCRDRVPPRPTAFFAVQH